MTDPIRPGDCVKLANGQIARVLDRPSADKYKVRVPRKSSGGQQFLTLRAQELEVVPCPTGWLAPAEYTRHQKGKLIRKLARRPRITKTIRSGR